MSTTHEFIRGFPPSFIMKTKKITLIDTSKDYSYEDYLEYCKESETEPAPDCSEEFHHWCSQMRSNEIEDFCINMQYSKLDCPLVLTGELGLWFGKRTIEPKVFESKDLIYKKRSTGAHSFREPSIVRILDACIFNGNIEDFSVTWENNKLKIAAHHHDGTNNYEVRKLNAKGLQAYERAKVRFESPEPREWWYARVKYEDLSL